MFKPPFKCAEFSQKPSKTTWRTLVEQSLANETGEAALTTHTYDGIAISPLYDQHDQAKEEQAPLRRIKTETARARPWNIIQLVDIKEPREANNQIKHDLATGADGVLVSLPSPISFGASGVNLQTKKDIATLLGDIDLTNKTFCLTNGPSNFATAAGVLHHLAKATQDLSSLKGSFGFDPIALFAMTGSCPEKTSPPLAQWVDAAHDIQSNNIGLKSFTASGHLWQLAGASEAQELAYIIASALAYVRALEASGFTVEASFAAIDLSLTVTNDIFFSIAKCRALRLLWRKIKNASNVSNPTNIRAEMSYLHMTKADPEMNMLRAVAATLAAGLGTVDALTLRPYTSINGCANAAARRLALNTQLIAQEESHIGQIEDPTAGSWYIENLTEALCQKTWEIFQTIEQAGGMLKFLQNGDVKRQIDPIRQARREDVKMGKTPIIGVTLFPNHEKQSARCEAEQPTTPVADQDQQTISSLAEPDKGELWKALQTHLSEGHTIPSLSAALSANQTPIEAITSLERLERFADVEGEQP